MAADSGGGVYCSTDSGSAWTQTGAPSASWVSVASSADGAQLAAAVYGGGIYTSQTTARPQLNMTCSGGKVSLSWTAAAANFVLQQKADLAEVSWTTLTNKPILNFTNLQYQMTVSPSSADAFFRLKAL